MFGVVAALDAMHIEVASFEIHVLPAQRDEFRRAQPVAKHQQDNRCITHGMTAGFARSLHHGIDFIRSEIVAYSWRAFLFPGRGMLAWWGQLCRKRTLAAWLCHRQLPCNDGDALALLYRKA